MEGRRRDNPARLSPSFVPGSTGHARWCMLENLPRSWP